MSQKLVISAGFAGMYTALSVARQRETSRASIQDLTLVFPTPTLMLPPRLYETNPENDREPVTDL
jgi:NADH:ubiquinone reductase (H+-translocating)